MFRTIKVKLTGHTSALYKTAVMYTKACQIALDYGFKNKTYNKNVLHKATYRTIREQMPQLQSSLVQCARDQAAEMLRREKCKRLPIEKQLQIRYNKRTFKFYPESGHVSLSTVMGRMKFPVKIYDYCKQYLSG